MNKAKNKLIKSILKEKNKQQDKIDRLEVKKELLSGKKKQWCRYRICCKKKLVALCERKLEDLR